MFSSPTTFVANLLAAMQVLMTLDTPLSTTMALPVTSKPIESTVENLAWQAWIELPPEQKQQVKSRKVTPKSIFTLPLRVECPEGHKQVDSKCIPIAMGSNAVLIDLQALGLAVGNTEDIYDYDDMGEELANPLGFGSEIPAGEAVKSSDGLTVDLKPPAIDEPLKFNIFQNKFHIFHEEPLEDYAGLSNEGLQSSEKEQNITTTTTPSNNAAANATALSDSVNEATNISEVVGEHSEQNKNGSSDKTNEPVKTSLSTDDTLDFKIEAISIPASGNHSSIQLVTTIMDPDSAATLRDHDKQQEADLTTLLQTESLMPLLNHTTATTLQNPIPSSLTTTPLREPSESSSDLLSLSVDEEITTLITTLPEQNAKEVKNKQEYTRSVTLSPLLAPNIEDSVLDASGDHDQLNESPLDIVTNDDTSETTTPIQLDDTTIIESHSSLSGTLTTTRTATNQQELKELLLQQEQASKYFEELQHMRKGQKDQHVVLKKSKVQPVEVLSTTTEATTFTEAAITAASVPTATMSVDELHLAAATPLLTVHNENENSDRFYYQHLGKQDNEVQLQPAGEFVQNTAIETAVDASLPAAVAITGQPAAITTTTAKSSETETIPLTSEIDLAGELRLINELVKGKRKPTTLTAITNMPIATTTATTTTTTTITATATTPIILTDSTESSASSNSLGESTPSVLKKTTLTTSEIWSKLLPLLTTPTTTPLTENSANESFSESQRKELNVTQTSTTHSSSASERSNRNSKIIRINSFNKISAPKFKIKDITTEATTTAAEEFTAGSSPASSSTENLTYEPYWWLPAFWRLDKPTSTEKQPHQSDVAQSEEEQPLLLRFWSAYVPKSS